MPYRRRPNTDLARIYALQKAVEMEGYKEDGRLVLSYRATQDAAQMLNVFRKAQQLYRSCYSLQSKSSKTYRNEVKMARMYVSHFIQVLNMTVQRGELRPNIKPAYGLDPDNCNNPDLSSEAAIYEWGKRVIEAERERTALGGIPIYNPTIAKVKVNYDIFAEHYFTHTRLRENADHALEEVTRMRPAADDLILDIWNQVEAVYQHLPWEERIDRCRPFGLIYYWRKAEKDRARAEGMQRGFNF